MRQAAAALAMVLLAAGCRSTDEAAPPVPVTSPAASEAPTAIEPLPAETAVPAPAPAPGPPPQPPPETTAAPAPASAAAGPGPAPPATPAALATELTRVERAVRDPATPAADLPALGLAQQVAYRQLSYNPGWRPDVLRAVPPPLHPVVIANTDAETLLASMHKRRPTTLPKWRIVAPPPAPTVLAAHQAAAREIGVPWEVLASIHLVETRMGRIRGTSTAGAKGPMQFLPATWAQYGAGGDIEDLQAASKAAARLLKRNGINGDRRKAVWSYNHSYAYVDAVLAYADTMRADERAFFGYHGWQVFYRHANGDLLLPEGWTGT